MDELCIVYTPLPYILYTPIYYIKISLYFWLVAVYDRSCGLNSFRGR